MKKFSIKMSLPFDFNMKEVRLLDKGSVIAVTNKFETRSNGKLYAIFDSVLKPKKEITPKYIVRKTKPKCITPTQQNKTIDLESNLQQDIQQFLKAKKI